MPCLLPDNNISSVFSCTGLMTFCESKQTEKKEEGRVGGTLMFASLKTKLKETKQLSLGNDE